MRRTIGSTPVGMSSFAREESRSRWIAARAWLAGALTSLAIIAVWALVIWLCVFAMTAWGLLPPSVRP